MEEVGDVGFAGLDRNVMPPQSVIIPFLVNVWQWKYAPVCNYEL